MEENEKKEVAEQNTMPQQQSLNTSAVNIPSEYKPISMWGYFGYEILFTIPCIGFILLCIFSFGGTKNINLKNFARSYFCFFILGIIVTVILLAILATIGIFAAGSSGGLDTSSYRM